ncbi:hypothetical protein EXS72_02140 [Candidatus Pacearchaeota archaeon]|nr:hypothetical protein [Candidatus Pacearchaeota archaeon]
MNFRVIDKKITIWLGHYGLKALRYSIAIIFIWFGLLKVVDYSPATDLVTQTVYWFDSSWFVPLLGWWEVGVGFCFLFKPLIRLAIGLLAPQMLGTFLPFILLPKLVFQQGNFFLPTLEGQYIIKNLVLIAAAMVIGANVRKQDKSNIS